MKFQTTTNRLEQEIGELKECIVRLVIDQTKEGSRFWHKITDSSDGFLRVYFTSHVSSLILKLERQSFGRYELKFFNSPLGILGTTEDAKELWYFLHNIEEIENLTEIKHSLEKVCTELENQNTELI